jgi:deferrochelatase/peroxidase EfeB
MRMQEGIFYDAGETPFRHFGIMFLQAQAGVPAAAIGLLLTQLWSMYQQLKAGRISDLPGVDLPRVRQTFTIGYGPKAFALNGARRALPDNLGPAFQFRSPNPAGGGRLLNGAGLNYATVRRPVRGRGPATPAGPQCRAAISSAHAVSRRH